MQRDLQLLCRLVVFFHILHMQDAVSVQILGLLILLFFILGISIILQALRLTYHLIIRLRPFCRPSIANLLDFYTIVQNSTTWDVWRATNCAISIMRCNHDVRDLIQLHGHDCQFKTLDKLSRANVYGK